MVLSMPMNWHVYRIPTDSFSANIYFQLHNDDVAAEAQPILEIWPLAVRSKWYWYRVSKFQFSRVQLHHGMEWNSFVWLAYRFSPLPYCLLVNETYSFNLLTVPL
jgi:hypothetical protein